MLPLYDQPKGEETAFECLLRLDSVMQPGLSEREFRKLFARCRCGKVTTRWVFKDHICLITAIPPIVIDLTVSDNGNSTVIGLTL